MSVATCNGFGSPETPGSELKRAEPDTELHCSPVLRPYAVTTRLGEGFLLRLAYGGQDGGQAGDSERHGHEGGGPVKKDCALRRL